MQSSLNKYLISPSKRFFTFFSNLQFNEYYVFVILMVWKLAIFNVLLDIQFSMDFFDYMVGTGTILLMSFWTLFFNRRTRIVCLLVLFIIMNFIILSDLFYFRYFKDFISIPVLLQARQVGAIGEDIKGLFMWKDFWFFLDIAIYIPASIVLFFRSNKKTKKAANQLPFFQNFAWRCGCSILVFCIGYILVFSNMHVAQKTWAKGLFRGNYWNTSLYNVTGILGFHGYDAYRYAKDHVFHQKEATPQDIDDAKQWFAAHQLKLDTTAPLFGAAKGKNILIVQTEALQTFMLNKTFNGQVITPNLNKLISESAFFPNYFHETGQGRTSDADFITNNSLYPLPTGSVFVRYPTHTHNSLPQTMKNNGYDPVAYHAYEKSFWNRYNVYPNMGYNKFINIDDYFMDEKIGWSLSDESFFKQTIDKIKTQSKPSYSFLITISSHNPFTMPDEKEELDVGDLDGTKFGDYLQAIHYVDYSFGKFIDQLKAEGMWDNTLFAMYGDHDNSVTTKDTMETFFGREMTDAEFAMEHNRVPLIIHLPNNQGAGVYNQYGGQLDFAPTILHLMGVDPTANKFMGNNLFGHIDPERPVVFRNGDFIAGNKFYVASMDHIFENGTCYDINSFEESDINTCKKGDEESKERLRISDMVILDNLLKDYIK